MNIQTIILSSLVLCLACTNNSADQSLSTLGFYATPDTIISVLQNRRDGPEEHFLLGLAYKKEKKYKEAIFHFANSCFTSHRDAGIRLFPQPVYHFVNGFHFKSDYYDDAVFELASLFYLFNEHAYVIKFTGLISREGSALYRDALLLKARSFVALQRYDDAISTLAEVYNRYDDPDTRAIALLRKGLVLEKKSDVAGAVDCYIKIFAMDASGWQASVAARHMLTVIEKNPQELNVGKNLLFGKSLYYAKEYKESAALLSRLRKGNNDDPDLNKFLVRALAQSNDTPLAQSLIAHYSGKAVPRVEILKAYADELWEMNRKSGAISAYRQVVAGGIEPYAQDSLKRIAQFMEERKQAGYEKYCTEYIHRYHDESAGRFLWLMGRSLIRTGDMERARRLLEESVSRFPQGGSADECRFWLYKIYTKSGRIQDALTMAVNMSVLNPDSPYTWLLIKKLNEHITPAEREAGFLKALKDNNQDRALFYHTLLFVKEKSLRARNARMHDLSSPDVERYRELEHAILKLELSSRSKGTLARVEKYFRVGYRTAINRELKLLPKTRECRRDKYIIMAKYGNQYHYAFLSAYAYLELLKIWKLKENIAIMPDESLKILFPVPFSDCVARYAGQYKLRNNILYAVMKAESLFKHNAVSGAGAVGLMQLMPRTAKGIARKMKIGDYELTDPCISIQIGAKYLSMHLKYFKNNLYYTMAAYNAGAGNVKKWKDKLQTGDMDYFTEFIPFIETRNYMLRTEKFLTQYNMIYGEKH
jgi:soluble lytic murein transglycosylase